MKNKSYNNFWQGIQAAAKTKSFPWRVMFELTYRCNWRCRHCYVPPAYRKTAELKTAEVFSILDQLKEIGCFYLGFTGGEVFVRNDILDILWYAKKKGFAVIIYTNGSLINEPMAEELKRLRPNKVDITIPALSQGAFERISRVPGSRAKVFKAIDLLHKKRVKLGFKTCLLKENEAEIKEIQDFAHSLGAQHRLDDTLVPRLDGSREPYRYRGKGREQGTQNTGRGINCGAGVSQAALTPWGGLKMCLLIEKPNYNVLEYSVKGAWEELRKIVRNNQKGAVCAPLKNDQ